MNPEPDSGSAGHLRGVDQAVTAPAYAEEPGARRRDRRSRRRGLDPAAPTREPAAGGSGVDDVTTSWRRTTPREVAPGIQQHVRERVPDFARRAQRVAVVAVGEYGAAPAKDAVRCPRHARRDGLHATGQRVLAR